MRMLLNVRMPNEPFNSLVRDGTLGKIVQGILDESKPEAVYFTEQNGSRGVVLIVEVSRASDVPSFAEPWFLKFNASCEFRIVMSPAELQHAGLETIGSKWQ